MKPLCRSLLYVFSAETSHPLPYPSPIKGEGGAGNSRPLGRACVTASRGSEWRVLQGSRERGLCRFPLSQFNHHSGGEIMATPENSVTWTPAAAGMADFEMAHSAVCAR